MKTLYPPQQKAAEHFLGCLKQGRHTLDTSEVGTGKTVVAAYLAKQLGMRVAIQSSYNYVGQRNDRDGSRA